MLTVGIVMVVSDPPMPGGVAAATLSTSTTAIAPAFWAFLTLTTKLQLPLSISAILPETAAAFVKALQPSVVDAPAPSDGSIAWTTFAVCPGEDTDGPKAAVPTV